ncbi:hypothetical protein BCT19_01225 [Vibrio splendidus]|uniref:recombinase family protein n=1 Tax=Vibrio splendidus TaxID=29497 RepID=UPI000C8620A7|nr:recombinase family protein [Vibrio splendidus]PMO04333.1 hypothetical protein BCT19_01225 [Vibrio splendidus]
MLHPYLRVSSDKQVESLSLTIQGDEALFEELAKKFNTTAGPKTYRDEGKSAYKGEHLKGALGELLVDIENNVIKDGDIIVLRHLDRLSRLDFDSSMTLFTNIINKGVQIYTVMDGRHYHNKKPNMERAIDNALVGFAFSTANEESLRKSWYTNKNASYRIKQFQDSDIPENGTAYDIGVGRTPFFVQVIDKVVQKSEHFDLMREIIELSLDGVGIGRCQAHLKKSGFDMSFSALGKLLRSEALFGTLKITLDGQVFELKNYYPAVCTEAEFYQIQGQKKNNTHERKRNKISNLAGIKRMFCGCGRAMSAGRDVQRNVEYYKCTKGTQLNNGMCYTPLRQDIVDKIVLGLIEHHLFEPAPVDTSTLLSLESEYEEKHKKFIVKQQFVFDNIDLFTDEIKQQLRDMESEIKNLRERISSERQKVLSADKEVQLSDYEEWQSNITNFVNGDNEEKQACRELIQRLVKRIEIDDRHMFTVTLIDDKQERAMLLNSRSKDKQRTRYFLPIRIVDVEYRAQIEEHQPELLAKYITEEMIDTYDIKTEDVDGNLKRLIHQPVYAVRDYEKEFFNLLQGHGILEWKRAYILKHTKATTTQWQAFKESDVSKYGWTKRDIEITTKSYTKQRKTIAYQQSLEEHDICNTLQCRSFTLLPD